MRRKYNLALMMGLLAFMVAVSGCGVVNRLRAKDNLNDGVREFNKGRYKEAEEKFKKSLELSPDFTNAQLFYARAVNALFDQGLTEDLGQKAIAAYDNIIKNNKDNQDALDKAYAFKANVYDQLSRVNVDKFEEYKQKQRETLLNRAELSSATSKTKADVYYTLGVGYWKESYDLNYPYVSKKQPIPPAVIEKMKPFIQQAHEYLQKTVGVESDYANAWFYEKLVFIEDTKVETNPARQKEFASRINEMQEKYMKMQEEQKQQAAQSEQPPASQ